MIQSIISIVFTFVTSFYSLHYTTTNGAQVSMSAYSGKKVLIVNIATSSNRVSQLGQLQQLHQQFGDSLVIIAVPSNQFGNEPLSDSAIKQFCTSQYNATFIIAEKTVTTNPANGTLYYWLTHSTENEMNDQPIAADYTKFLIDKEGNMTGVFSPNMLPTDPKIISMINH